MPLQPVPVTVQVTLVGGLTWAVNCWVPFNATVVEGGKTVTEMCTIFTVTDADLLESAADVAFTVTVAGLGGAAGAVYRPLLSMLPQAAPVQPDPETLQVTL